MQTGQKTAPQALKFAVLLAACMLAPILIISIFPFPPGIRLLWDWANAMGYMAMAVCLLLFVYKGRPHSFPAYSGRFFANLHRDLGYVVILLIGGHIGVLLAIEPLLLEYLKPTAPLHILSGLLATILMLLLLAFSIFPLRRLLWRDYHLFRHVHAMVAITALGLLFYHILLSGFYLNSYWKKGLLAAVTVSVVAYYTMDKVPAVPARASRVRDSSRYSRRFSYGCTFGALLFSLLYAFLNNLDWQNSSD